MEQEVKQPPEAHASAKPAYTHIYTQSTESSAAAAAYRKERKRTEREREAKAFGGPGNFCKKGLPSVLSLSFSHWKEQRGRRNEIFAREEEEEAGREREGPGICKNGREGPWSTGAFKQREGGRVREPFGLFETPPYSSFSLLLLYERMDERTRSINVFNLLFCHSLSCLFLSVCACRRRFEESHSIGQFFFFQLEFVISDDDSEMHATILLNAFFFFFYF